MIVQDGDDRRIERMEWGVPTQVPSKRNPASKLTKYVTNVRNLSSPFWRSMLTMPTRRCLVPVTSFSEFGVQPGEDGKKPLHWFDVPSRPIFAFADLASNRSGERLWLPDHRAECSCGSDPSQGHARNPARRGLWPVAHGCVGGSGRCRFALSITVDADRLNAHGDAPFKAVSRHSRRSRWMPWELGFFDGHNGKVGVLPVTLSQEETFKGEEYVSLYPFVDRELTMDASTTALWINRTRDTYARFDLWVRDEERIRKQD